MIDQVSIFIGNNSELMDWFKSMIGYESKEHDIERPTHTIPKPDLNTCQTTGNPHESPSYRVVPKDVSHSYKKKKTTQLYYSGKINHVLVEINYVGKY